MNSHLQNRSTPLSSSPSSSSSNQQLPPPPTFDLSSIQSMVQEASSSGDYTPLIRKIGRVFSTPDYLNASFLIPAHKTSDDPEVLPTLMDDKFAPGQFYGLDLASVRQAYQLLLDTGREGVTNSLTNATIALASAIRATPVTSDDPEALRFYLVVLSNPLLQDPDLYKGILSPMLQSFSSLKKRRRRIFQHWMAQGGYSAEELKSLLGLVQQFMTLTMMLSEDVNPNRDSSLISATKFIGFLNDVNDENKFVSHTEFYNEVLADRIDLREDITNWKNGTGYTYCHHPYILDPGFKAKVLHIESMLRQKQERDEAFHNLLMRGIGEPLALIFKVRREHLIRDALLALQATDPADLHKELKVQFIGEEGIDQGGVQKEFFQLVVREIFDPQYGMFTTETDGKVARQYWFVSHSQDYHEFKLIGTILGLAIYNGVILDVHFPRVVYKKLMGLTPTLHDLKHVQPELARGLEQLLTFEGDVEDVYGRTLSVTYDVYGEKRVHELIPGGEHIPLTNENRHQYVDLYVRWLLVDSVARQFDSFKDGFQAVCNSEGMKLFRYEELELLICGSSQLDFHELEAATQYDGGFEADHPTIINFWDLVHNTLTPEQQRRLLFFATGSDRAPIGGLGKLPFVIVKKGGDDDSDQLPSSHTCFNALMLPNYSTKEKLLQKLVLSINNSEGFGLM
eukprot:TRINITY_DN3328_c0_g1_i4.p1 TRINITY_DN3328_c0_g1~~TRINITY_DN3328_c0_g1_i4.p1  ORF type:complete len:788 (-),score=217.69 TRINITY_DN3328_c0_g1_i4:51-2093(-)